MNQHEALIRATCAVLKEVRIERGLSQTDMAKLSGLNRSYIVDYERITRNLAFTTMARLAAVLGLKPSSLLELAETKLARMKMEADRPTEPKPKPAPKPKLAAKPKPRQIRNVSFRRCIKGHRWSSWGKCCPTCNYPGIVVQNK
jgi:transcriptional regulator with XRE-family HTH domain